ncbi:PD-(D/E)XK nuclease family protein [Actinomyces bowdenii]|uniref:DNA 3'-5' helicase n=1 Tax=Actinomyces bowdenii TaxID=131109 RepID=A0A3P1UW84_9ACTO|nr:PD-(D/E)XK nuclease family protein [Actinomyces bowdenii]MBO3724871.1 PD-(D/E)XK nuclease family protein [Actinomyces bowdenii]RRD26111.1 DNA helicase UvrD [Actinomyces bowdenii]
MPQDTPPIRLLAPQAPPSLPAPDPSARAVMDRVAGHGNAVVLGAAGTGKTTLALRLLSQAVAAGRDALLLAPTRLRADHLRAQAAHLLGQGHGDGTVRVRTPAALALTILTTSLTRRPDPLPAPVLLAGAEEDAALAAMLDPAAWPGLAPEAVASRAFRSELRNLLARAGELGVEAEELAGLGQRLQVPIWGPASRLLRTWDAQGRPTAELRSQVRKVDTARLQDRAAEALGTWEADAVGVPRPVPDLVIADDYQDCTAATARLLAALTRPDADGHRAQVVVLGDPDTAVETFRGGTPSLLIEAEDRSGLDAERLVLATRHRGNPALTRLWEDQSARLPITGTAAHRRPRLAPTTGPTGPTAAAGAEQLGGGAGGGAEQARPPLPWGAGAVVAGSPAQEAAHVARMLREERIHHSTPWSQMAVIVRSSGQAGAVARELRRRGVPVTLDTPAVLLRAEPAAAALLDIVGAGLAGRLGGAEPRAGLAGSAGLPGSQAVPPPQAQPSSTRVSSQAPEESSQHHQDQGPHADPRGRTPVLDSDLEAPPDRGPILDLLTSPLIGLSPLDLRRVRRRLRSDQQAPGLHGTADQPGAEDLLLGLVACPRRAQSFHDSVAGEPIALQAGLVLRAARIVDALRRAVSGGEADIESLLWAAWEASGRAEAWRALAMRTGPEIAVPALAEAAEHDLDVVTALFKRAEVWAERHPGAPAARFLAELAAEILPSDSVAPQGIRSVGVGVMTPAAAAGRQWQVVAVMGLNAESWPDLRLRDSMTRAGLLVDAVTGRLPHDSAGQVDPALARAQVRADERRMLLASLTRATRRLLVTATADADHAPSSFHTQIAQATGTLSLDEDGAILPAQDVGDLTLRGLVGELRRAAVEGHLPGATAQERHRGQEASRLLAALATQGVSGAAPRTWAGAIISSSQEPLVAPGQRIRVSPSDVEGITDCPLRWFLQRHGGSSAATSAQSLGSLIHRLAERAEREQLRGPDLMEAFEAQLPALGYPGTWLGDQAAQQARAMVERLDNYLQGVPGGAGVEVPIRAELDLPVPAGSAPAPRAGGSAAPLSPERPSGTGGRRAAGPTVPVTITGRIDRLEAAASARTGNEGPREAPGLPQHGGAGGRAGGPPDGALNAVDDEGRHPTAVRVVDIKTGKSVPDRKAAPYHPQLATYRLALEAQGYEVVGGALVLLGKEPGKRDGLTVISPPGAALAPSPDPDSGRDWARDMVRDAALDAVGPLLQARTGPHCRTCRVKDSCPLQPEGRRVVA